MMKSNSVFIKKQSINKFDRAIKNSNVKIIRTAHIQVPYLRRISSLISNFTEILSIFKKNYPDIVIGYSISNGIMALFLSKLYRIPFVFYSIDKLHTLVPLKYLQSIARIFTRIMLYYSDQIIADTDLFKKFVINKGAPPKKVKVLLNGISLENTIFDEIKLKKLRIRLSISEKDFVIFFMGYLYDFAGLIEIINYYNDHVKNGEINIKFLIIGDGGIYNKLKDHIRKVKADWVILTGRMPFFEIIEYIQLADLCLLSYAINEITKEITLAKIIEYMAMKKAVLSNNLPGVMCEIGNNNGVIFAESQIDLIKKIKSFVNKKEELMQIGQIGYNFVKNKYTWQVILKDLKEIIIKILKKKYYKPIN